MLTHVAIRVPILAREVFIAVDHVRGLHVDSDVMWQRSNGRIVLRVPQRAGVTIDGVERLIAVGLIAISVGDPIGAVYLVGSSCRDLSQSGIDTTRGQQESCNPSRP